jgi:hypothetical protein
MLNKAFIIGMESIRMFLASLQRLIGVAGSTFARLLRIRFLAIWVVKFAVGCFAFFAIPTLFLLQIRS